MGPVYEVKVGTRTQVFLWDRTAVGACGAHWHPVETRTRPLFDGGVCPEDSWTPDPSP